MLIEEIMKTKVVTLTPNHTIQDAITTMRTHRIRHIPIVTDDDYVVGILAERDIKEVIPSTISEIQDPTVFERTVDQVMTPNPITSHPMDFVEEAAVIFYENRIGSLPVTSQGKLVGIVTETDLLYKYIELTGAHQPGSQIEIRVLNRPGILFEVSKVFHEHKVNVLSVLVYPDKENIEYKILVIRINSMNPLKIIQGLKEHGFEVLWPNVPGIDV